MQIFRWSLGYALVRKLWNVWAKDMGCILNRVSHKGWRTCFSEQSCRLWILCFTWSGSCQSIILEQLAFLDWAQFSNLLNQNSKLLAANESSIFTFKWLFIVQKTHYRQHHPQQPTLKHKVASCSAPLGRARLILRSTKSSTDMSGSASCGEFFPQIFTKKKGFPMISTVQQFKQTKTKTFWSQCQNTLAQVRRK